MSVEEWRRNRTVFKRSRFSYLKFSKIDGFFQNGGQNNYTKAVFVQNDEVLTPSRLGLRPRTYRLLDIKSQN